MPRGPWKILPGSIPGRARRGSSDIIRGDRLKSPEEMRREWAGLMRAASLSAERAADNEAAREKSAPDLERQKPAPDPAPQPDQAKAQTRDHLAERTAWAERLRGFAADPVQEARREAEPVRTRERTPEPGTPVQAPQKERGGVFQKLRDFVRGWFEKAARPDPPPRDRAADRRHDAAGDRQAEHVQPPPAQTPMQEPARKPEPKPEQARQPVPEQTRPAERLMKSDFADELLAEARARLATQTPEQRAERERQADPSRGRDDGGRERTRHRHGLLWELVHPFQDHRPHDHHRKPEP